MEDITNTAAPGKEGAGQSPATGNTSAPSAREKELEKKLERLTKERDGFKTQVGTLTQERDDAQGEVTRLKSQGGGKSEEGKDEEPTEADPHAETKELLKRFNLKAAYILPDGSACFDEAHAKHVAGPKFSTLEVVSAE